MADAHAVVDWWQLPAEAEALVRRARADIFDELEFIGSDEPGLVSAYLKGIAEPLAELEPLGVTLIAVTSPARVPLADGTALPIRATTYILAPRPCFYRLGGDSEGLVHRLGSRCSTGADHLAQHHGGGVTVLGGLEAQLELVYEGAVPWCRACQLDHPDAD